MSAQEQFYLDVQGLIFEMSRFTVGPNLEEDIAQLVFIKNKKDALAERAKELKLPFDFSSMYSATVAEGFDDVAWDSSSIDC